MADLEGIEVEVKETIDKYSLIEPGDKVAVALSGGKDSTSVLYILKKLGYDVHGLMIDLYLGEWSKIHRENMTLFCKELSVPFTIIDIKEELGQGICFIKAVLRKKKNLTGCTVCGIIKKWLLNRGAKRINADKIATGHNLDDEAQNVLMNFLKGNLFLGINSSPSTGSRGVDGFVQRIKPLFFVAEDDIRDYAKGKGFKILYDKCPCAFGTYRVDTREWTKNLKKEEKRRIVENFQACLPMLRSGFKKDSRKCSGCGEPSSGEFCSACKIFAEI